MIQHLVGAFGFGRLDVLGEPTFLVPQNQTFPVTTSEKGLTMLDIAWQIRKGDSAIPS